MTSREIRHAFLDFFAARDHRLVPSSPLVLPNDPTLLFANAGMNQFKDAFTGREQPEYRRAASVQKCLRVSGKHNDLEMVGRTPRHHTFFEMLGNFSFGDYFKREAIEMAWELVTGVLGLPEERLWVTVFGGSDAVAADRESLEIWRDRVGVPAGRILSLGESDNFWRMGDTGPCGPCTELHYDLGEDLTSVSGASTPETDERRFIEIWNLVFPQFDQREDGLQALSAPNVDTGMGLERIVAVVQEKRSNFETDLFVPLLQAAARRAGTRPGLSEETDFSLRVIADHARALCFLVADGVVPANDKRGYVLRRLLRRAIRHGRKLNIEEPFLHEVTPVVIEELGEIYPELVAAREAILEIGRNEEERFAETLFTGLTLLDQSLSKLKAGSGSKPRLPGKELFRLYDTYGFPVELARDIAEERGIDLDEEGFEAEMAKQRSRAQASWKRAAGTDVSPVYRDLAGRVRSRFAGYTETRLHGVEVLALLDDDSRPTEGLDEGREGEIVLDATPFYAEAGGQVADTGALVGPEGRAEVVDVQTPVEGLSVHRVRVASGRIERGQMLTAEIDERRRESIRRNHTATHLLHAALREVVGTHVKQAGSLVAPDRLRFDFSHFAALSDRAMADIESLINRQVLADASVETEQTDLDSALRRGAMALFGEKYSDRVRLVRIGDFSLELCGGTHCASTGQVGLVKLTQERGIASGTRRVEAVSGEGSLSRFRRDHDIIRALEEQLSVPGDKLLEEFERRMDQLRLAQKDLEGRRLAGVREQLFAKAREARDVGGVPVLVQRIDGVAAQELRELADALRGKLRSGVVVLGRVDDGKVSILVALTPDLVGRLHAGDLVRELGRMIGGGGGGRPDMAEAGGKDAAGLDRALEEARGVVGKRLESPGG